MQLDLDRTIVAVSSPLAGALRAIVRVSGSQTSEILRKILVEVDPSWLEAAKHACAIDAKVDLNWLGRTIRSMVYYWPTQQSFTGEPCAELHLLGSLPIVRKVVDRILAAGASPAERGEYALRAFLAGKLDLVQAEAILGVIESTGIDQLQWALGQLGGNISQPVRELRSELMELLAHLEAGLDFVEEDIEFISMDSLRRHLVKIAAKVDSLQQQLLSRGAKTGEFELALVGHPNAGKSSLFNALLGTQRAIVSSIAGTTRDVVSSKLELGQITVDLIDTAGMEAVSGKSPRALAQIVLKDRVQTCDAVMLCVDLTENHDQHQLDQFIESVLSKLNLRRDQVLVVGTKSDLVRPESIGLKVDTVVSIDQSESIQLLRKRIQELVELQGQQQFTLATHHTAVRCSHALSRAGEGLSLAIDALDNGAGEELIASELHFVLDELATIIGEVHNDDILGEIFSRFCIGK